MKIKNKAEIDAFCWDHRNNGCRAIKGEKYNLGWEDMVTGESLLIKYECEHGRGLNDYCEPCGRIHNET